MRLVLSIESRATIRYRVNPDTRVVYTARIRPDDPVGAVAGILPVRADRGV